MRLTTLLDTLTTDGGAGQRLARSANPRPAAPLTPTDAAEFDRLLAGVIPCRNEDPELWFAERTADVERAKALCADCPLRAGCLAGAVERAEPWGVWGGEVFVDGAVVARKRGRGRPSKAEQLARQRERDEQHEEESAA
ncbi:WhiB family transcriptional regulator [Cellulomonas sp. PhB143]|uniref:WhiB family transcriptional regulator n=1 Tax=Cellulomonas sp. PhB143 TaxID=2485186 RepID=UPI000F46828B|nr:WhiB family transcriptional regulator [Cellulomonas sp. PhB143]ROS76865.1 WhiB family redox-sensing transcriptional regulator [Cellulomonas sp. PhB143]